MRWLAVLVVAMTAAACTPVPGGLRTGRATAARTDSPAPVASPSSVIPSPLPSPGSSGALAVLVDVLNLPDVYDIALVNANGETMAFAHPRKRTEIADAIALPYVSASNSRVYYLDGDSQVRYLKSDNSTGIVTTVPGTSTVRATFAVSPDDKRIAVGLLDYSARPVKLTVYVEDVGGANHHVIFTSTNHYVWPVAWHAGHLVVAYIGPNAVPLESRLQLYGSGNLQLYPYGPSPYGGINFHVINPVTAVREAIISGGGASGLLSKAGVAVVQGDADDWRGQWLNWSSPNDYGSYSAAGSLSPDGTTIAACCDQPNRTGQIVLWFKGGTSTPLSLPGTSTDWVGWFNDRQIITGFYQRSDGTPHVYDLDTNRINTVDAHGIVAAMLPGGLD
jgi:hypothetical protein